MAEIKKQTFGVEIEMVGINNYSAIYVIKKVVGGTVEHEGGYYNKYVCTDAQGRKWTTMDDGSLSGSVNTEFVTPVLGWDDIELLQDVVRALREKGGRADSSCGIHVHVGADEHTPATMVNLMNLVYTHYELIEKALKFSYRRRWCKKANEQFMVDVNKAKPATMDELAQEWYGYDHFNVEHGKYEWLKASESDVEHSKLQHYHGSRYQLVNLHSYFQNKGVEFRAFNGTMHAGEIKAYIQFCCALNAKAINLSKSTMKHQAQVVSEYWQMSDWLKTMGIKGNNPEFKTLRHHLLKNMSKERA